MGAMRLLQFGEQIGARLDAADAAEQDQQDFFIVFTDKGKNIFVGHEVDPGWLMIILVAPS